MLNLERTTFWLVYSKKKIRKIVKRRKEKKEEKRTLGCHTQHSKMLSKGENSGLTCGIIQKKEGHVL